MSDAVYDDVITTESERAERKRVEVMVDIYESSDGVRDQDFRTEANTHQPLQKTGSACVKTRRSRAVLVCLVLLCFLLLTAVIGLSVYIYTNNTNYTREREELQTSITNLTEERDQLVLNNQNLTNDKKELLAKNDDLMKQRYQLQQEILDGWIYYQSSLYFFSSEKKSWTESRRNCTERGADLIIINNTEEQDFVKKFSRGHYVWIGLTDTDEEGRWKWVDGSELSFSFWGSREPNGGQKENCVLSYPSTWADYPCDNAFRWVCEKIF